MRNIKCSPSVAHTNNLQDNFSETLAEWCRLRDLNSRPTDYKSVALPTELKRHKNSNYIKIIFFQPNFVEAQMAVRLQHCSH